MANCFQHCKIRSDESVATKQQASENEGICGLHEVISSLQYRNAMDVEHLFNYPSKNDAVMESSTDEEIIQGIMDTPADDDHDLDDSCVLRFPKIGFSRNSNLK